jgi:hypothetical protein
LGRGGSVNKGTADAGKRAAMIHLCDYPSRLVAFVLFGQELEKTDSIFWLMMQLAMLAGFLTSYPVDWWLLRAGIKEAM